ncbi:hypothetical protein [Desulfobulbus sp.]|uniref:hypothetical protein n=1 Tax=Desulfobulbus sp. TaxID=895 RepID=UPI00286F1C95|nr:hypothetical protein [Desulfobulbus sp.]
MWAPACWWWPTASGPCGSERQPAPTGRSHHQVLDQKRGPALGGGEHQLAGAHADHASRLLGHQDQGPVALQQQGQALPLPGGVEAEIPLDGEQQPQQADHRIQIPATGRAHRNHGGAFRYPIR